MTQKTNILKYTRIGAFLWFGGYQVAEDFSYQTQITGYEVTGEQYRLDKAGRLFGKKFYVWDGPTGAIKTKDFIAGSLVHDILCEMINKRELPQKLQCMADEEMLILNRSQKMPAIRRALTFAAVTMHMNTKGKAYIPKVFEVSL